LNKSLTTPKDKEENITK